MKPDPAKVVYILGHPYSGSTLFSVALGNGRDFVNLGEVSCLENDYKEETRCLCGHCLVECKFWQTAKALLDEKQTDQPEESRFQLNRAGVLSGPDKRHLSMKTRLGLILGVNYAIPKDELENYARKNERFFSVVSRVTGGKMMIDASKSSYRLQILMQNTALNLKVIWLKRSMKGLFASKMKRVKLRNRFYIPFISPMINIAWLLNYHWACIRVYKKLPERQKCVIFYEDFIKNPVAVQNILSGYLDTDVNFKINEHNLMPILDQHVYVGNRWLFRRKEPMMDVQIRADDPNTKLTRIETFIFRFFSLVIPILRS